MKLRIMSAVLAVLVAPLFSQGAEEPENPFKKAKVGEFAKYNLTVAVAGQNIEGSMLMTVKEKTEKVCKLTIESDVAGMKQSQEQEIDLTKPYDPTKLGNLPGGGEMKMEKLKSGKEKVKVGEKEYETTWDSMNVTASIMGQEIKGTMKYWQAKDFSLGTVKMEMSMEIAGAKMEMKMDLKESGKKSD